jgi:uncharacterized membrane protein
MDVFSTLPILLRFPFGYIFLLGIIGNLLLVIPLFLALGLVSECLWTLSSPMDKFFSWVFTCIWRNEGLANRCGLLVCAMAFVFSIDFNRAFAVISLDVVVDALITTFPTMGLLTGFGGVQ